MAENGVSWIALVEPMWLMDALTKGRQPSADAMTNPTNIVTLTHSRDGAMANARADLFTPTITQITNVFATVERDDDVKIP